MDLFMRRSVPSSLVKASSTLGRYLLSIWFTLTVLYPFLEPWHLSLWGHLPHFSLLKFKRETQKTTENGYTVSTRYYSNEKCGRCPHRDKCHSSKNGYRTVRVNQILNEYRPKVLEALTSEEGTLLRMNRSIQVEGVFGVLKEDYGFRRFLTRGKKNVETQFFLLAFALNIEKLCNREKKGRIGLDLFPLNAS